MPSHSIRDLCLGAVYVAFGLLYGVYTLTDLRLGTALNMGPGYFPLILSIILCGIGTAVAIRGLRRAGHPRPDMHPLPWRAILLISVTTVVFSLLVRGAGLVPTIIVTVLICTFASTHATLRTAVITSVVLAVFCSGVFVLALGLPLNLLGTWFR